MKQELKIYYIASEYYPEGYTFGAVPVGDVDMYENVGYAVLLDVVEVDVHKVDVQPAMDYTLEKMQAAFKNVYGKHQLEEQRMKDNIEKFRDLC